MRASIAQPLAPLPPAGTRGMSMSVPGGVSWGAGSPAATQVCVLYPGFNPRPGVCHFPPSREDRLTAGVVN